MNLQRKTDHSTEKNIFISVDEHNVEDIDLFMYLLFKINFFLIYNVICVHLACERACVRVSSYLN